MVLNSRIVAARLSGGTLRRRLAAALAFALVAGVVAYRAQFVLHAGGGDHYILWRAVRSIASGGEPYVIDDDLFLRLFYPLPALVMALPFSGLPPAWAAFAFTVVSAGFLGYAITRDGLTRLAIMMSAPFFAAAQFAQSTPLVLALGLSPVLAGCAMIKPNIGLALFAAKPSRRFIVVAGVVFAASLVVFPRWPIEWIAAVRSSPVHHAPVRVGVGAASLLAVLRWRRPEARLLLGMALLPHGLAFYDELPLWLVASTARESMLLCLASWIGLLGCLATSPGSISRHSLEVWSVAFLYLPALVLVLRRPNVWPVEEGDSTPPPEAAVQ